MSAKNLLGVALVCSLCLAASTTGCTAIKKQPQAMMLEDLEPPANADDAALRDSDEAVPAPTETSNLRADPDDPRRAAMLEDLEQREPTYGDAERRPLPEEPPADPKRDGYAG